jgi:hypothetical protein
MATAPQTKGKLMMNRTIAAASAALALSLAGCAQDERSPAAENDLQAEAGTQQDFQSAEGPGDLGTTQLEVDSPPAAVDAGIESLDAANELNNN